MDRTGDLSQWHHQWVVLRLLEVDGEEKTVRISSPLLRGCKFHSANLLEELKGELGEVREDGITLTVYPRSYLTLVFTKPR